MSVPSMRSQPMRSGFFRRVPGTGAEFRLRLRQGLLRSGRGVGACVGALGVGQGVPRRGQWLHGHMGGSGQGRDCRGGGHRRGGVRLPAAENRLPHQQHGGQGQRRQARTAQHPHMAALARAQPVRAAKG